MKTYTICGSMKFAKKMKKVANQLETENGYKILQCVYVDDINKLTNEDIKNFKKNIIGKSILVMEFMLLMLMGILVNQ